MALKECVCLREKCFKRQRLFCCSVMTAFSCRFLCCPSRSFCSIYPRRKRKTGEWRSISVSCYSIFTVQTSARVPTEADNHVYNLFSVTNSIAWRALRKSCFRAVRISSSHNCIFREGKRNKTINFCITKSHRLLRRFVQRKFTHLLSNCEPVCV
jgi:hypothetical protein